ncbi:MAG: hypothetical protein K8R59_05255 [Thermoanaerobaculales bacterium]|nr:hypothetical protein [Thermoanaerobaculales bacterium]
MNRGAAAAIVGAGVIFILFGLLFLVGSAGQVRRIATAGVCLVSGALVTGFGVRRFKEAEARSPERIRAEILDLAKREDGEISRAEIFSVLGKKSHAADPVLDALVLEGICSRMPRDGAFYFTFPDLQPRLTVLRCDYCSTEQDISSDLERCPGCGGPLSPQVVIRSLSDGSIFSMDEED